MTNLIIENKRVSKVLEAIKNENVLETVLNLIHPQKYYGGSPIEYNIDKYNGDAIDDENLLISVPLWAKNILEFDNFSKELSEKLIEWQEQNNTHFWDYNIQLFLEENGYDEHYFESFGGYTYNHSDCNRLDRYIHYTVFKYDFEYYVCFSIHHGADARIGFSDSIVLKVRDVDYFHCSMSIVAYDTVTDIDYEWYQLEDVATFDKETKEWRMNDTNNLVSIYSSANGF